MRIFIGSDHRGFALKAELITALRAAEHDVNDVGVYVMDPNSDYPDIAAAVGRAVAADPTARGIVLCGSGVGVAIAANKIRGVRAGTCTIAEQVRSARAHDDINVLAIAADHLNLDGARAFVRIFLGTSFDGVERHSRRIEKIRALEQTS